MDDLKNDIEKYLRGEMSSSEMHRLEKKALDDSFSLEALDGLGKLKREELDADISKLNQALKERIESDKKSKSIWYWPMRIAAGLLMLAITSYILYTLVVDKSGAHNLALTKEKVNISESKPIDNDTIKSNSEKESFATRPKIEKTEIATEPTKAHTYSLKTEQKTLQPQLLPKPEQKIVEQEEVISKKDEIESDIENLPTPSEPVTPLEEAKKVAVRAKRKAENLSGYVSADALAGQTTIQQRVIAGKVLDEEDGTPMPGVTVTIKGEGEGTTTNMEGYYQLNVADTLKRDLIFSFVGMQNAEVPILNQDSINVSLSPDFESLSEVVVVGYASPSDEGPIREKENIYEIAEPVGGKKAYKLYLTDNMHYPVQALENKIEGRVTVQFFVETSGMLSNLRVTKSLGYGCDDEVIRLIRQGPKWTPTKRNDVPLRNKVKVKLKFKLPQ